MKTKNKLIFIIFGIILGGLTLVAATYAFMTISATITNGNYNTETSCFNIDYDITNADGNSSITGTLLPSATPLNGLSGKLTIGINSSCNVIGKASIYLYITSSDTTLLSTVSAHCELSSTLKTLTGYTTESDCTSDTNNIWVTSGTAFKYAIYNENPTSTSIPIKVGYISSTEDTLLVDSLSVTKTSTSYYIYLWLDGNVSDNTYESLSLDAYIHTSVVSSE